MVEEEQAGDDAPQQSEGSHHSRQPPGDLVGGAGYERVRRNLLGRHNGAVGDLDDLDMHSLNQVREGHAP